MHYCNEEFHACVVHQENFRIELMRETTDRLAAEMKEQLHRAGAVNIVMALSDSWWKPLALRYRCFDQWRCNTFGTGY